jgi:hypothetical protein
MTDARTAAEVATSSFASETYAVVTLNPATGLFVIINQDQQTDADTATVVAGLKKSPNSTPYSSILTHFFLFHSSEGQGVSSPASLSLGEAVLYGGQYSLDPSISRLSDNSFALTYYDNSDTGPVIKSRYGKVVFGGLIINYYDYG